MTAEEAESVVTRAKEGGYFDEVAERFWSCGSGSSQETVSVDRTKEKLLALVGLSDIRLGKIALGVKSENIDGTGPTWAALRRFSAP